MSTPAPESWLAIINPNAGGGRCGRRAPAALAALRAQGVQIDEVRTTHGGHATQLAAQAVASGRQRFLAVGGDGTGHEVVNGLMAAPHDGARPTLGYLPLGTGNSFLRDFTPDPDTAAPAAVVAGRTRPVDLMRLEHRDGVLWSINLLSVGFVADICTTANRRFKALGQASYVMGVFAELVSLRPAPIPVRTDGREEAEAVTFLSWNNSRFTGGKMMMAPGASTDDGLIECIRVGAMGRLELLRTFPKIFAGTHIHSPAVTVSRAKRIEFLSDAPLDVMVDGEVLTVRPVALTIVPGAVDVAI